MVLRSLSLAAILFALPATASAQIAGASCLTRGEAEGLMTYALPGVVRSLSSKCAAALPATAPLILGGTVTAGRYQPEADKAWPIAKMAFDKLAGAKMSDLIGDAATQKLLSATITTGVIAKVKLTDCATIDRVLDLLQPLPTANMAVLATALIEFGKKDGPIKVCPAPLATPAPVTSK